MSLTLWYLVKIPSELLLVEYSTEFQVEEALLMRKIFIYFNA